MQSETKLTLGSFAFGGLEIPSEIVVGGSQRLAVHELVGGARIIDAMGRADRALEWSGLFFADAIADPLLRALYLDNLRISGAPVQLQWSAFSYLVIVKEFEAHYKRLHEIPYRIVCEVIADLANPYTQAGTAPVDQVISDDMTTATATTVAIGDAPLTASMNSLTSAIAAVSTFAGAAQSTINSVLTPLANAQLRVGTLISSVGNTVSNVTTFGGLLPGNPASKLAATLSSQIVGVTNLGNLYAMRNVLGRINANLGSINAPVSTLQTAGGNLFQVAQQKYGDATAWTGIAKANKLTDPFMTGLNSLTIPPVADKSAGVLTS
jgi:hypothetical protein